MFLWVVLGLQGVGEFGGLVFWGDYWIRDSKVFVVFR